MKSVTLTLRHLSQTPNSTVSARLTPEGERICYIIEDGYRKVKVKHETRIPAGVYEIVPRVDERSRFYTRYKERYSHKFVPWMPNVPNFIWILFHIGNTIRDTSGCLLTVTFYSRKDGDYVGWDSEEAYLKFYDYLDHLFSEGYRVYIEIGRGAKEKLPEGEEEVLPEPDFTEVLTPVDAIEIKTMKAKKPQDNPGCSANLAAAAFVLLLATYLIFGNLLA